MTKCLACSQLWGFDSIKKFNSIGLNCHNRNPHWESDTNPVGVRVNPGWDASSDRDRIPRWPPTTSIVLHPEAASDCTQVPAAEWVSVFFFLYTTQMHCCLSLSSSAMKLLSIRASKHCSVYERQPSRLILLPVFVVSKQWGLVGFCNEKQHLFLGLSCLSLPGNLNSHDRLQL